MTPLIKLIWYKFFCMNMFYEDAKKIIISPSIFVWGLLFVVVVWFLYQIVGILLLLFLAIILSASLESPVKKLMSWKVSRGVAIAIVYVILFGFIFGILMFLIPAMARETGQVVRHVPEMLSMWGISESSIQRIFDDIKDTFQVSESSGGMFLERIFSTTVGVVRTGVSFLAVIAMSLYILAVDGGVEKFFRTIVPKVYREYVVSRSMEAYQKTGRWLAGQVLLMGIVFVLYFLVLSILGVPGAFVLAVWGGLFEIVPYIGPAFAAIPAVILGVFVSPVIGILVLVSYVFIQKLENYWLVPKVMERATGLHPLVVILALLAGGRLGGFIGLLLAVPMATVAGVFLQDVFEKEKV